MSSSSYEANQNTVFLVLFSLLAVFSGVRLFSSAQLPGGRRVITLFNALIFSSSLLRVALFLLPLFYSFLLPTQSRDIYRDTVYGHLSSQQRTSPSAQEKSLVLLSELVLAAGNWCLYGIFALIACYWAYMLKKLHGSRESDLDTAERQPHTESSSSSTAAAAAEAYSDSLLHRNALLSSWTQRFDSIELFQRAMAVPVALQLAIALSYALRGLLVDLLLLDALLLALCAALVLLCVTYLSGLINHALQTMEAANRSAARAQIKRIYSIMLVANLFFYTRVVLEGGLGIFLWLSIVEKGTHDFLVREPYWTIYISIKHGTEIVVLVLELIVSTAIKSYENPKISVRQVPKAFRPGFSSYYGAARSREHHGEGEMAETEMAPLMQQYPVYGREENTRK